MRLNPDSYFETISKEELIKRFRFNESIHPTENLSDLKGRLKHFERTRSLQLIMGIFYFVLMFYMTGLSSTHHLSIMKNLRYKKMYKDWLKPLNCI